MAFPPAYASVNPAVAALFGNEMAINRAAAADALAQQQLQIERERQAAENIYRQQALQQQNEQQQLNAFLNVMANAQREAQGRQELEARERIAKYPYSPEVSSQRMKELEAELGGRKAIAEIASRQIDPRVFLEQTREFGRQKEISDELGREQAEVEAAAYEANRKLQSASAKRLKAHQDVDSSLLRKPITKLISPLGSALVPSSENAHSKVDQEYLAAIEQLKKELEPYRGKLLFRGNRFEVNLPAFKAPAVPVLPPIRASMPTNAAPSGILDYDLTTGQLYDLTTGQVVPGR